MKQRFIHTGVVAIALLLTSSYGSHAIPTLRLSANGGTTWLTVADSDGDGVVTFMGAVGPFGVNVTTGVTKPVVGSATAPFLDVSTLDINGTSSGSLIIQFSETDFGPVPAGPYEAAFGGVMGGTLKFSTWGSANNVLFAKSFDLTSQTFGAGSQSGTVLSAAMPAMAGPFSLTEEIRITHMGKRLVTSGDAQLMKVPVPDGGNTLVMVAFSFGAIAVFSRRSKHSGSAGNVGINEALPA